MKAGTIVVGLIFCIFMGITAISMGLGAVFPSINQIARPFVCADGKMVAESRTVRPYPGKTVTTVTWFCDEGYDKKTQLSLFPIASIAGSIYGLILFAALTAFGMLRRKT